MWELDTSQDEHEKSEVYIWSLHCLSEWFKCKYQILTSPDSTNCRTASDNCSTRYGLSWGKRIKNSVAVKRLRALCSSLVFLTPTVLCSNVEKSITEQLRIAQLDKESRAWRVSWYKIDKRDMRCTIVLPWWWKSTDGEVETIFCENSSLTSELGVHENHSHDVVSMDLRCVYRLICISAHNCWCNMNQLLHSQLQHRFSARCLAAYDCHDTKRQTSTSSGNWNATGSNALYIIL